MNGATLTTGGAAETAGDSPHALAGLTGLMAASEGSAVIGVALIDGPVDHTHEALAGARITLLGEGSCAAADAAACRHGTFIAGLLAARRGSAVPGICPGSPLLLRSIFTGPSDDLTAPSAAQDELAEAILQVIAAGVRVINLSLALLDPGLGSPGIHAMRPGATASPAITVALDRAMRQGVLVAAAAGNQGLVGSTAITRHPWVIPVVACERSGRPLAMTNLSASAGRNGTLAPGEGIIGATPGGGFASASGSSVAVPFVTGALALLASVCPWASAAQLRWAIAGPVTSRRSVTPPLLNAEAAWRTLQQGRRG